MTTPLLEKTKDIVSTIASGFTDPDDDFEPVVLFDHGGEIKVVGIDGNINQGAVKDLVAKWVTAALACHRSTQCAMVTSAWMAGTPVSKDDYESGNYVMPADDPERKEVVNVMCISAERQGIYTAEIKRDGRTPPTLGEWDMTMETDRNDPQVTLGGRFGHAIVTGLELGSSLPPELAQFADRMIADGKTEKLIEHFQNAMTAAIEMHNDQVREKQNDDRL